MQVTILPVEGQHSKCPTKEAFANREETKPKIQKVFLPIWVTKYCETMKNNENRIKSFFRGLFKKKAGEQEQIQVTLELLPTIIQKDFESRYSELEDFYAKKLAEIKFLHSKATRIIQKISETELENKENERLNRAALTSKKQFVQSLSRLLEKIDPKERAENISDAKHYFGESQEMLFKEVMSFRKSIAYTSFYLKDEMKELGEILQEMVNAMSQTNKAFDEQKELFDFEKIKEKIVQAKEKQSFLKKILSSKNSLEQDILVLKEKLLAQGEITEKKAHSSELAATKTFEEELLKVTSQKQELKTQISALLINVDRPLQRFSQLVDSGRWKLPKEEKELMNLFLTNPIMALRLDPKADNFKKVLNEVIKAITEGEVELKEKEKQKRLEALQEIINYDFFGKIFWKMNELQRRQDELTKLLGKSEAKKELEKEEEKGKDLNKKIFELEEKILDLEKDSGATQRELNKDLELIKIFCEKSLGKKVIIVEE